MNAIQSCTRACTADIAENNNIRNNDSTIKKISKSVLFTFSRIVPSNQSTNRLTVGAYVLISLLSLSQAKSSSECQQQCQRNIIPLMILTAMSFPTLGPFAFMFLLFGTRDKDCMNSCLS